MKKSLRTVVTAAMFAAANMSALPTMAAGDEIIKEQNGNRGVSEQSADIQQDIVAATTTAVYPVYGTRPPHELTTTTTSTTSNIEEFLTMTTTTDYPTPLYGTTAPINLEEYLTTTTTVPQPVYGPPIQDWVGDVNLDGSVDSFDVLSVRKMLIKGTDKYSDEYKEAYYGDMNNDGKLTIADLILLQKYVLGKVTKQELQQQFHYWYGSHDVEIEQITPLVPGTAPEEDPVATTTTTTYDPRQDVVVTLYGIAPIKDIITEFTAEDQDAPAQEDQPQDTTTQEK